MNKHISIGAITAVVLGVMFALSLSAQADSPAHSQGIGYRASSYDGGFPAEPIWKNGEFWHSEYDRSGLDTFWTGTKNFFGRTKNFLGEQKNKIGRHRTDSAAPASK